MTTPGNIRARYDSRLRRAEKLAASLSFATELLQFYGKVASLQTDVFAELTLNSSEFTRAPLTDRSEPNLTQILPRFRRFLTVVEKNGPTNLAVAAKQINALATGSWIPMLDSYWETAGIDDHQVGAFAQFFPRAIMQPCAEAAGECVAVPSHLASTDTCPRCAARPLLGVLRVEGDGGKRFLLCSFCLQEWEFRRILCPVCGETAEDKLPVYIAEQMPHIRVECCDSCKFCLRTIDLTKDGHAVPLVDDLAALPLTLWAQQHGYSRLQPNLLGT